MAPAESNIEKYTSAALKRFGGSCESLTATRRDESILFEFSVSGAPARLEVVLGHVVTPTKVRGAFVELGMEISRLNAAREGARF